jgi:hypothetical protein
MPIFEIEKDGKTFEVEAPDQQTALKGFGSFTPQEQPSLAVDIAKGGASGLGQGALDLVGLPGTVKDAMGYGANWLYNKAGNAVRRNVTGAPEVPFNPNLMEKSDVSGDALKNLNKEYGVGFYEPQTMGGKFAETVGRYIPGAVAMPAKTGAQVGGNILKYGVLPGAADETAGQATKGTVYEPYARAGAGLLTGFGAAAAFDLPRAGERMVARGAKSASNEELSLAQALINKGAENGVEIPLSEALQQVTSGRTNLGNVQRIIEGAGQNTSIQDVMARRPQQVGDYVGRTLENIAPQSANPNDLGRLVSKQANKKLTGIRQNINKLADPFYKQSAMTIIPEEQFAQISSQPAYQQAVKAIKADPILAKSIEGIPENSVGFFNEVKIIMDEIAKDAATTGKNRMASLVGSEATGVRQAAIDAAPDYGRALEIGQQGRERVLSPLESSSLGKLAETKDTAAQLGALFPAKPLEGISNETARTISALNQGDSKLADAMMRQYMAREAGAAKIAEDSFGGARFVNKIAGNPIARENMLAAANASGGAARQQQMQDLIDVLMATGQRQKVGTTTAFNQKALEDMAGVSLKEAANPLAFVNKISDTISRAQMGKNIDKASAFITNPNAADELLRLRQSGFGTGETISPLLIRALLSSQSRLQSLPQQ